MYWQIPIQIVHVCTCLSWRAIRYMPVAEQLSVSKVDGTNVTCSAKMRFIRLQIYS
jgi:hypothetical protein